MATVEDTMGWLGGQRVFGRKIARPGSAIPLIEGGFPYGALDHMAKSLGLQGEQISAALGIPRRTLARRKASRRLAPTESDRLYRLARLFAQTVSTLASAERARDWLLKSNRSLGGRTPLELSGTDAGAREVERVLGRIEHGIFS